MVVSWIALHHLFQSSVIVDRYTKASQHIGLPFAGHGSFYAADTELVLG
jgi:hypothetical protein